MTFGSGGDAAVTVGVVHEARHGVEVRVGFKRTIEDFVCEHCGTGNRGDGYTNHCYRCLYSKHVDVEPGDRANPCGGLMAPIGVLVKGDRYTLLHRCVACGHEQKCRTGPRDDREAILAAATAGELL